MLTELYDSNKFDTINKGLVVVGSDIMDKVAKDVAKNIIDELNSSGFILDDSEKSDFIDNVIKALMLG